MAYRKDFFTDSINTISGAGYCLALPDVLSFQPGSKSGWSAWSLSAGKIVMQPKNTRYQFTPDIYFQSVGGSDDARPLNIQVEIAVDMFIRAAAGSPDSIEFDTRVPGSYMANMAAAGCAFLRRSQKRYSFRHVGSGLYISDEIRPEMLIDILPVEYGLQPGIDIAFYTLVNWRVYALGMSDRQTITGTARFCLDGFFLSSEQSAADVAAVKQSAADVAAVSGIIYYEIYGSNPEEWCFEYSSMFEVQNVLEIQDNNSELYDAQNKPVLLFLVNSGWAHFFVYIPKSLEGTIGIRRNGVGNSKFDDIGFAWINIDSFAQPTRFNYEYRDFLFDAAQKTLESYFIPYFEKDKKINPFNTRRGYAWSWAMTSGGFKGVIDFTLWKKE